MTKKMKVDKLQHQDQCDQSATQTLHQPKKLFVNYPYPILNELNRAYTEQQERTHHSHDLASLRWYKDCFHKAFSVLHGLSRDDSPSALLEKSLKQSHLNKRISKNIVNDLQKKTKPTRVRRILASSMTPPPKDEKDQNQRCVRVLKSVDFDQQPNDN
ncbi:unnamed protein product [Adineta ricciae]|uniref:Uncharacterized protein n=1 Tax=Adineta ricciae TaxID=249248 RepID=A0A815A727_ADIRI|nr:unnamed protein product [Adineta ricciae]